MKIELRRHIGTMMTPAGPAEVDLGQWIVVAELPSGLLREIGICDRRPGFPFCHLPAIEVFLPEKRQAIADFVKKARDESTANTGTVTVEFQATNRGSADDGGSGLVSDGAGISPEADPKDNQPIE